MQATQPQFNHKTLREEVALYLRNKILCGDISPGGKINEVEVAKQLGISRGPVREALRQIEQEGFVLYTQNKGCTVKTLSAEDMAEFYLLRCALETLAMRIYHGKVRKSTLEQLEILCVDIGLAAKENNLSQVVLVDQAFHAAIVQEAGLEMLYKSWSAFDGGNAAIYHTMRSQNLMPSHTMLTRNHSIIVDALRAEDVEEAVRLIQEHYMVVPRALHTYNRQQPQAKQLDIYEAALKLQ